MVNRRNPRHRRIQPDVLAGAPEIYSNAVEFTYHMKDTNRKLMDT